MSLWDDAVQDYVQDEVDNNGAEREDFERVLNKVFGPQKLDAAKLTLEWACDNDDEHEGADDQEIVHQNLADIAEVGGAICPQCGRDMELVSVSVFA